MKRTPSTYLSLDRAIDALHHPDGRMVQMRTPDGPTFFVLPPGRRVLPTVAAKIISRPYIVASADPLFPQLAQTWRRMR
jgi:hypothetical protein